MKPSVAMKPWLKGAIALLCLMAAGMSLWLSVEKWSGRIDSLAGCGAGSGCANVLGSKWSVVFGDVPVSAFSFLLYVSVFLSLGLNLGARAEGARWFRSLAAWMCLWAAVWFTGLQVWVIGALCPYCMTMHGVGVLLGLTILVGEREKRGGQKRGLAMILAAFSVIGLSVVQYYGPEPLTYRVDTVDHLVGDAAGDASGADDIHSAGDGSAVTFLNGRKSYRVEGLPHLGSADAKYVVVEYFDYTCEACREMHVYLEEAVKRHPGELAVVVLPIPLNRSCNPHLAEGMKDHENACELARLTLKVWRADSSKFPEFHRNLFELQGLPIEAAESMAYGLVGEDKMSAANDAWVDAILSQNVKDYQLLSRKSPVMPKLLLTGSVVVQGVMKDGQTLESLLKEHLGLK